MGESRGSSTEEIIEPGDHRLLRPHSCAGAGAAWRSTRESDALDFRDGKIVRSGLHDERRSPRSRRAVGVGDVGGERGDRRAAYRGLEPRRRSIRAERSRFDPEVRTGPDRAACIAALMGAGASSTTWARVRRPDRLTVEEFIDAGDRVVAALTEVGAAREAASSRRRASRCVYGSRTARSSDRVFTTSARSPRSRRAVGVGDVGGERGDRARPRRVPRDGDGGVEFDDPHAMSTRRQRGSMPGIGGALAAARGPRGLCGVAEPLDDLVISSSELVDAGRPCGYCVLTHAAASGRGAARGDTRSPDGPHVS